MGCVHNVHLFPILVHYVGCELYCFVPYIVHNIEGVNILDSVLVRWTAKLSTSVQQMSERRTLMGSIITREITEKLTMLCISQTQKAGTISTQCRDCENMTKIWMSDGGEGLWVIRDPVRHHTITDIPTTTLTSYSGVKHFLVSASISTETDNIHFPVL